MKSINCIDNETKPDPSRSTQYRKSISLARHLLRNEFIYIVLISLLLLPLVASSELLVPLQILRALLGLAFVLFLPGYCLQAAAFPTKAEMDGKERLALSFGLSLVLIPGLALILDRTSWGITVWSVFIGLFGIVLLLTIIANIRIHRLDVKDQYKPLLTFHPLLSWRSLDKSYRNTYIFIGVIVIFFGVTAISIIATPKQAERMTEFYVLGATGKAESFPYRLEADQPTEIIIGVRNLENATGSYRIEVRDGLGLIGQVDLFDIVIGETKEIQITFTPKEIGEDVQLIFSLFRNGDPIPYRTLHLWVAVKTSFFE